MTILKDPHRETMPCQPLCKFLLRCAFLPVEAFSKLLEILSACQNLPYHAVSTTSPMPLHKNKYTSSSGHQLKQRLFKQNKAFTTREVPCGDWLCGRHAHQDSGTNPK